MELKPFNELEQRGTVVHSGKKFASNANMTARILPARWYVGNPAYHEKIFIKGEGRAMLHLRLPDGQMLYNNEWMEVHPFHGDSEIHYYSLAGKPQEVPESAPTELLEDYPFGFWWDGPTAVQLRTNFPLYAPKSYYSAKVAAMSPEQREIDARLRTLVSVDPYRIR